jgi:hypothetical protein
MPTSSNTLGFERFSPKFSRPRQQPLKLDSSSASQRTMNRSCSRRTRVFTFSQSSSLLSRLDRVLLSKMIDCICLTCRSLALPAPVPTYHFQIFHDFSTVGTLKLDTASDSWFAEALAHCNCLVDLMYDQIFNAIGKVFWSTVAATCLGKIPAGLCCNADRIN